MDWDFLIELGKGILWVLIGIFMFPMLCFLDWGWDRWAKLWGSSKAGSMLFLLCAPVMLFCFAIGFLFADKWQKMLAG